MNVALRAECLDYISLCTGGGGLDFGVELAIPCARAVVCVEREAFAVARLATAMQEGLMAPTPIWSDVRTLEGRRWRGLVDGVIGGIPCQPHSVAGRQLGEDDERDLWSAARRIVVQSGAWFVVIENVEGILHTGGCERVCRDLGRLGFEVEVGLFSASECGATHQRNRIIILAVADDEMRRRSHASASRGHHGTFLRERSGEWATWPTGDTMADSGGVREYQPNWPVRGSEERSDYRGEISLFPPAPRDVAGWLRVLERWPQLEPAVRRMADGLAGRVDRLRMLGNGVVSIQAAYALRTLATRLVRRASNAERLVRMMMIQADA